MSDIVRIMRTKWTLGLACATGAAAAFAPSAAAGPSAPVAPSASATSSIKARCKDVAHVGDSLTSSTLEPLRAAYATAGVTARIEAFGGRAIFDRMPSDPKTGRQAALDLKASGFSGCWVVALGTNDTANVAAGAKYTRAQAIDAMMTAIDATAKAPVLWVNAYTTKAQGFWANDHMALWNDALKAALARWPNLRVFDWAALAATGKAPFKDGVHHTKEGYAVRNEAIVRALVSAFPKK